MPLRKRPPRGEDTSQLIEEILRAPLDYYAVLGIPKTAHERAVRGAFRQRSRRVHPDHCVHARAGEAQQALVQARDCLLAPIRRRHHDLTGHDMGQRDTTPLQPPPPPTLSLPPLVSALLIVMLCALVAGAWMARVHAQRRVCVTLPGPHTTTTSTGTTIHYAINEACANMTREQAEQRAQQLYVERLQSE